MTNNTDSLSDVLLEHEKVAGFTTEKLVSENELGCTEFVVDAQGKRYVRKCFLFTSDEPQAYERIYNKVIPGIAPVLSTARIDSQLIVITQYIPGESLYDLLKRKPSLSFEECLALFEPIVKGLSYLHTMDAPLVHRDINPNNIIICNGKGYLIDFGIARTPKRQSEIDTQLWGTQGFACPEQFGFGQSSPASDIYSLAKTMLYALDADTLGEHVANVLTKASSVNPKMRYQNVEVFFARLKDAYRKDSSSATQQLLKKIGWHVWQVILSCFVIIFLIGAVGVCFDDSINVTVLDSIMLSIFFALIPWMFLANPFKVTYRILFYQENHYLKVALSLLLSLTTLFVYALFSSL